MRSRFHAVLRYSAITAIVAGAVGLTLRDAGATTPPPPPPPPSSLARPVLSGGEFSFSLGYFSPSGNSDFWSTSSDYLTVDPSDFGGAVWGSAFAAHVNPYFDLQVTVQYYAASTDVVYRDFVDEYGAPFQQTHTFSQVPVDLSFKFLPITRMSRDAKGEFHTLRPVVPYLGGGIGAVWWDYTEEGWFVDDIYYPSIAYYGERSSSGVAPSFNLFAGIEFECNPWVAVWVEARYRWATGHLGGDYTYEPQDIDLSGGALSAGVSFRY